MITIVVPSFNEAQNVGHVVRDIAATFAHVAEKQVVVVDDGSTDATAAVLRALVAEFPFVKAVPHPRNMGLGVALQTGYAQCREGVAAWLPADGQFEARWILAFHRTWERTRCAMVVGNVTASNRKQSDGLFRLALSKGLRLMFFMSKRRPINFNGLMLFERERLDMTRLKSVTGVVNFEILEQFEAAGWRIEFENISVRPRLSGASKVTNLRTSWASFMDLLRK